MSTLYEQSYITHYVNTGKSNFGELVSLINEHKEETSDTSEREIMERIGEYYENDDIDDIQYDELMSLLDS